MQVGRKVARNDRTLTVVVLVALTALVVAVYAPILPGNFLADDNIYIAHLIDHGRAYAQGERLYDWFFGYNGTLFLRPMVQWLWLFNYIAWNTSATGFYAINILLFAASAFLLYVLARELTGHWLGGAAAGLLYALHPIHPDSVAWIADCVDLLAGLFSLLSAVFFVFYRRRGKRHYLAVALVAFGLALLTKESTVALPLVVLAFDALYEFPQKRWRILPAQIGYWLLLPAYAAFRVLMFQGTGVPEKVGLFKFGVQLYVDFYALALARPFLSDMTDTTRVALFAVVLALVVALHRSKTMWIGLLWLVSAIIPAGTAYVAARLTYIPSAGLALFEAGILAALAKMRWRFAPAATAALVVVLALASGAALVARVSDWANAGTVASVIPQELKRLHPTLPENAFLYFVGVPDPIRGVDVYTGDLPFALRNAYRDNPYFNAMMIGGFPILTGELDKIYFVEYRRRTLVERQEVKDTLVERQRCAAATSKPAVTWDFARGAEGWEAWNDMTDLAATNGAVAARATGKDPFMAGPAFEIPSLALGDIEITMRVKAGAPVSRGAVYWLVAGMGDFSPALAAAFDVQADGAWHTYRVDIAATRQLVVGERVVQLRVDPTDAPADIEFQSIRVFTHCTGAIEN